MKYFSKPRIITALIILLLVPIGFYTKYYSGPGQVWVNNSLGGSLYVVFWCLVVFFFFPKAKPLKITIWVFSITCILEFLQLWHPPLLEYIRGNFIGRTILGNSFNWMDYLYYFFGGLIGFVIVNFIIAKTEQ